MRAQRTGAREMVLVVQCIKVVRAWFGAMVSP